MGARELTVLRELMGALKLVTAREVKSVVCVSARERHR
jgi:hypothetical protein